MPRHEADEVVNFGVIVFLISKNDFENFTIIFFNSAIPCKGLKGIPNSPFPFAIPTTPNRVLKRRTAAARCETVRISNG